MAAYNASKDPVAVKDNETFQQAKVTMVKAHVLYLVFTIFRNQIREIEDKTIRGHLEHVAVTFALDSLVKDSVAVFDAGFFGRGTGAHLNQALAM